MTKRPPLRKTNSAQIALPFWQQLRTQLTLAFVLLGTLPVLIVTVAILNRTGSQATDQVYNQLDSVAELKSDQILRWLDEGDLAMGTLLSGPNSVRFANFAGSQTSDFQEQAQISKILAGAVGSEYFKRMFIYNESGVIIASSDPADIRKNVKDQPYFNVGLHADYIQSPIPDPVTKHLVMYITRPLRSGVVTASGALVGELNIDTLADIMTERTGLGQSGETYLVSLQNNNLLTPSRFEGYEMNVAYSSEGIDKALKGIKGHGTYNSYRPVTVLGSYQFIPELQAALLAEVEESQALAAFRQAQWVAIFIALISNLAAIAVGFIASQRISRPIGALTLSAQHIGAGNLKAEVVELRRQDEIGVLARAFNQMQSELAGLYEKLEQRVADRTKALSTVAEVSTAASTILDTNRLLQEVVDLSKERFGFYHAHIYLLDETGNTLVLSSGAGEIGRQMVNEGQSISLDREQSLVARAAREKKGVTVNDVTTDPDFLPNPMLPDTRAEMAVPMMIGDTVIGVFDVQSEVVGRFTEADVAVQSTLAAQVASAVQNTRQYIESLRFKMGIENSGDAVFTTDLKGSISYVNPAFEKVYGYTRAEAVGKNPRIIKSGLLTPENYQAFWGALLSKTAVTGEIVNKRKDGQLVYIAGTNSAIVNDAGEIIGFLAVHHDITEQKKNQELVAERAKTQEAINLITQRIQSATTIEDALQVAARELGNALGKRQTLVVLESSALVGERKGNMGS